MTGDPRKAEFVAWATSLVQRLDEMAVQLQQATARMKEALERLEERDGEDR